MNKLLLIVGIYIFLQANSMIFEGGFINVIVGSLIIHALAILAQLKWRFLEWTLERK